MICSGNFLPYFNFDYYLCMTHLVAFPRTNIVYKSRARRQGEWEMSLTHRSLKEKVVKSRFNPVLTMKSYNVTEAQLHSF